MSVFYEHCTCGAEFRVEVDSHASARNDLARWRTEHKHERAAGDRYVDHTGTHHQAGFDTYREGRIEEIT